MGGRCCYISRMDVTFLGQPYIYNGNVVDSVFLKSLSLSVLSAYAGKFYRFQSDNYFQDLPGYYLLLSIISFFSFNPADVAVKVMFPVWLPSDWTITWARPLNSFLFHGVAGALN